MKALGIKLDVADHEGYPRLVRRSAAREQRKNLLGPVGAGHEGHGSGRQRGGGLGGAVGSCPDDDRHRMELGNQLGDRRGADHRQWGSEQHRLGVVGAHLQQGFGSVVADQGADARPREAGHHLLGKFLVGFGQQQIRGPAVIGVAGTAVVRGHRWPVFVGCHPLFSFTCSAQRGGRRTGIRQPKRPEM